MAGEGSESKSESESQPSARYSARTLGDYLCIHLLLLRRVEDAVWQVVDEGVVLYHAPLFDYLTADGEEVLAGDREATTEVVHHKVAVDHAVSELYRKLEKVALVCCRLAHPF